MPLAIAPIPTGDIPAALPDLARLRIAVFRDWPYLYDGDAEYEARYLATYAEAPGAVVVAARDGDRIVGAATGAPLGEHDAEFGQPLADHGYDLAEVFYCAESVLLPAYRGQGAGHAFFDLREAHARTLGHRFAAFCSVKRPEDHPMRPETARPLDPFWRARGYAPVPGALAEYSWRDLGEAAETPKPMQIWIRELGAPQSG